MSTTTFTETLNLVSRASADPIAQAVPAPLVKYYEAAIQEGPCGPAEAIALITTDRVDRDGEVVLPQGARLENYKRNPILMWGHAKGLPSEGKAGIPIGKNLWIKTDREGSGLIAKHLFDTKDDFSATICNKVKDEFLKCYSITFLPIKAGPPTAAEIKSRPDWKNAKTIYREWELVEYSVVAMPSNVDAVTLAKRDKTMDEITTAVDSPVPEPDPELESFKAKNSAISSQIETFLEKKGLTELIEKKAVSKGVALGDLRSTALDAIIERFTQRLRSYLWSLAWNDQHTPESIPGKLEAACEEMEEALSVAFEAMEKLRYTPEQLEAAMMQTVSLALKSTSKDHAPGETEEEEEAEEEVAPPFKRGDHVKCNSKMCKGYGVIKSVHKDGLVPDVDDDVMGTIESPAARVQMYKKYGDGWKPTMIHRGMMMSDMEATETLNPPKKKEAPVEEKEFTWSETEKATYKAAVMNSPDFLKLAEQRIMERFDVLLGRV